MVDAGYGGSAGYYIAVHTLDTPYDYFYAHLRSSALVRAGQSVTTGQLVGYVGETGDAVFLEPGDQSCVVDRFD